MSTEYEKRAEPPKKNNIPFDLSKQGSDQKLDPDIDLETKTAAIKWITDLVYESEWSKEIGSVLFWQSRQSSQGGTH